MLRSVTRGHPSYHTQCDQDGCDIPDKILRDYFVIKYREASGQRRGHCFHEFDNPEPLDRLRRAEP